MILLDTHIWIWWVNENPMLNNISRSILDNQFQGEIAISIISCWEVAKAVENGRLKLKYPVKEWLSLAIANFQLHVIPIDNAIILDSTSLPGNFHKDPADQLIVATARTQYFPLLTADEKI